MTKLTKAAILLASLVALAQGASAATTDWTGGYVGIYAGPNSQQGHASTTTVFSAGGYFAASSVPAIATAGSQKLNTTGENLGLLAGYNFHVDENWVLGLEADFGLNHDTSLNGAGGVYPCCAPTAFTVTSKVQTNWLMTVRPRLGYAWDNWLAYVTAGLAMGNAKSSFLFTDTFATAHESGVFKSTQTSWTAGGGIENRISSDVSVRLEYLYANLGSTGGTSTNLTAFGPPAIAFPTNVFTHRASLNEHMVRFAVAYHL